VGFEQNKIIDFPFHNFEKWKLWRAKKQV